jgi:flagellar motor component MotA
MFIVIGIVVVFGSIVAGYLMEHGNLGKTWIFAKRT